MTEMTNERKEIVQVSGLTILVVMALLANFLIVGLVYRYHYHAAYAERKAHGARMNVLYGRERDLKSEVVAKEGVANWNETRFMKEGR